MLFCTSISRLKTPSRGEADFDVFNIQLRSVPEMKPVTKWHQNPVYRNGDNGPGALSHPYSTPKSPIWVQLLMGTIQLPLGPDIMLVAKFHRSIVKKRR